ncbi:hypothetical protein [Rubellimicrobium aerolatum]|uniref:DUF3108 domain-containing protein n=1 Tax=Rubellimicrobium aerolatum TaxID=490979 RepID=A0ABW0SEE0_9RHOB|nr:hypothetical protein [Rubellimicrobium aerolatum]MBP1805665.1 hypothetical protein [Rubellimicrobium aerolatum]
MRLLPALVLLLATGAARAETAAFEVRLAGGTLGHMEYETDGPRPSALRTLLDSTPLGVLDGTWEATSRPAPTEDGADALRFRAVTASSRKARTITFDHRGGAVLATGVDPAEDATDLSLPANVPPGVLDPVQAFGRLMAPGPGCPEPFRLYDGRRVIEVATTSSETAEDGALVCHADYEVIAGPGHLSPFRFRSFALDLTYRDAGTGPALAEAAVSAGIFTVRLVR